jgi:hypothetical protein
MAKLRHGAVAVIGHALDHDRYAVRRIPFIGDLLEGSRILVLAGAAPDAALDVVLRHVL